MVDGYAIDASGYMLEPVVNLPDGTKDGDVINSQTIIVTTCPDGFYKPQWSNGQWIDAEPLTEAQTLQAAKAEKIKELTAARDDAIATNGFTSSADGTSRQYRADLDSQNLMDQLAESISLGVEQYPQAWVTADGTQVSFSDVTVAKQFLSDFRDVKNTQWSIYMPLQHQTMSATTVSDVDAVNWPMS